MKMLNHSEAPATLPATEGTTSPSPAAAPAPAGLAQVGTFATLLGQSAARQAGNGAASAALLPILGRADTWVELYDMQAAVGRRYQQLNQAWFAGWQAWGQELADLKRANTMSEHVEQQFNLVAQAGALLKNQAADLLNLQENIEVDYGYWVAEKVRGLGD